MNSNFWMGLGIGAVISFVASLFANYFTPTFSDFMDRRRTHFIERTRKSAMRQYAWVDALHSGKQDKYFFIINSWFFVLVYVVFSMGALNAGILSTYFEIGKPNISYLILAFLAFTTVKAFYRCFHMLLMQSRLEHFEEYKRSLIDRWGRIDQTE
ncbi:MAG: hypothetical protein M3178_01095 [Pseudomonadota bacterium]|nr:hypothetical protein [Pseudomonadota bacterium]